MLRTCPLSSLVLALLTSACSTSTPTTDPARHEAQQAISTCWSRYSDWVVEQAAWTLGHRECAGECPAATELEEREHLDAAWSQTDPRCRPHAHVLAMRSSSADSARIAAATAEVLATASRERQAHEAETEAEAQASASAQAEQDAMARQAAERQAAVVAAERFWDAVEFAQRLAANDCESMQDLPGVSSARSTWVTLREYQRHPERDKAIKALEACRLTIFKARQSVAKSEVKDVRTAFAVAIEDSYDEANPYARGDLIAKVSGTELIVTMRGGFGGRARHTGAELESWCATDAAMFFSEITLKSSAHGTFSCQPELWPGSTSALADLLVDEELLGPWDGDSGELSVPPQPEELSSDPSR
jgi:hypothetical protein